MKYTLIASSLGLILSVPSAFALDGATGVTGATAGSGPQEEPKKKEEIEAIAPSSPPLEVDDPGIPEPGEFEINFVTEAGRSELEFTVDANFGARLPVLGEVQLKVELTRTWLRGLGMTVSDFEGLEFGIKKIIHDDGRITIALYPQVQLPASHSSREKEIGEKLVVKLPILISERLGKRWVAVQNVSYEWHQNEPDAVVGSVGLAYTISQDFAVMGSGYIETEASRPWSGERVRGVDLGFVHPLIKDRLNLQVAAGYEWAPESSSPRVVVSMQWLGRFRKSNRKKIEAEIRQQESDERFEKFLKARQNNPTPPLR